MENEVLNALFEGLKNAQIPGVANVTMDHSGSEADFEAGKGFRIVFTFQNGRRKTAWAIDGLKPMEVSSPDDDISGVTFVAGSLVDDTGRWKKQPYYTLPELKAFWEDTEKVVRESAALVRKKQRKRSNHAAILGKARLIQYAITQYMINVPSYAGHVCTWEIFCQAADGDNYKLAEEIKAHCPEAVIDVEIDKISIYTNRAATVKILDFIQGKIDTRKLAHRSRPLLVRKKIVVNWT